MLSKSEQLQKLEALKIQLDLNNYYKIDTTTLAFPSISNRVNAKAGCEFAWHDSGNGRCKWIGYTNYLFVDDDGEHFKLVLLYKNNTSIPVFVKGGIEAKDCLYWMKRFYSAARQLHRTADFKTLQELKESEERKLVLAWLKGEGDPIEKVFQDRRKGIVT